MADTYYFSHDYNSRSDYKIKRLLLKHGMLGYGIWWAIIEDLYSNNNSLVNDYESIAFDLHSDVETIKSVINDFDLFVFENNCFGSLSVQTRLDKRNETSRKARESVNKRWGKIKDTPPAPPIDEDKKSESKTKNISEREGAFEISLIQFSNKRGGKYEPELVRAFFNYWTEKNKSQTKMRFELEKTFEASKRLATWFRNEQNKIGNNGKSTRKNGHDLDEADAIATEILREHARNKEHGASDNIE